MVIKEFSREYLVDTLGLPWNLDIVKYNRIDHIGTHTVYHTIVFKDGGKYWETKYGIREIEVPKIGQPWENEENIRCVQVEPKMMVITDFVPVAEAEADNDFYFRNPTPQEMESINKYIESISKGTGVNFWDLQDDGK